MKKSLFISAILGGVFIYSPIFSQTTQNSAQASDMLGLPGDNLNLTGVLNLFQESATLEEFEKKLNTEDSKINNLDLDGDGKIDYIKVVDNVKGDDHTIVLQDAVNQKETQDLAVIEVGKDKNGKVQIQIIGDEALYGKDYIIEPENAPAGTQGTTNPGYTKQETNVSTSDDGTTVTNNYYSDGSAYYAPDSWAMVHYLYSPYYSVYASPWYWGFYPSFWYPWHPLFYHEYYNHWYGYHYHGYYQRGHDYYNHDMHGYYYGQRRNTSVTVNQRREAGAYRSTYSRPDLGPRAGARNNTGRNNNPGARPRNNQGGARSNNGNVNRQRSTGANPGVRSNGGSHGTVAPRSSGPSAAPRSSAPASHSAPSGGGRAAGSSGGGGHSSGGGGHSGGGHSGGGRR